MVNKDFKFLIYNSANENISINAIVKDETIWLTQKAMAELFGVNTPAISKHLKNIFSEKELDQKVGYFQNGNNHSTWCIGRQDPN